MFAIICIYTRNTPFEIVDHVINLELHTELVNKSKIAEHILSENHKFNNCKKQIHQEKNLHKPKNNETIYNANKS